MWEAFLAVGPCLGLLVQFGEYLAAPGRLVRRAAPKTHGAYLIQLFVIVPLQMALLAVSAPALVTVISVPVCFVLAEACDACQACANSCRAPLLPIRVRTHYGAMGRKESPARGCGRDGRRLDSEAVPGQKSLHRRVPGGRVLAMRELALLGRLPDRPFD